jgi:hypothetical protein
MSGLEDGVKQPKIYAYTFGEWANAEWKGPRDGRGLIKVGFTARNDVNDRIKEQINAVKLPATTPHELLLAEAAITNDGQAFMDHAVHNALAKMGVHNIRGEWFEATVDEIRTAVHAVRTSTTPQAQGPKANFGMRPEQKAAVEATAEYFKGASKGAAPHFLWNAKMRFGKTFTTYQLAKKMGWTRLLVLTYKPAVETAWREDLIGHEDFSGWRFKGKSDAVPDFKDAGPLVWFASFQDVLGKDENGQPKLKNLGLYDVHWDAIAIDEYHFGAWGEAARELYLEDKESGSEGDATERKALEEEEFPEDFVKNLEAAHELKVRHFLYLSGTPFRAIAQGEFLENQIFNWTYSDEQRAKASWAGDAVQNPYASLPTMFLLTYEMPDKLKEQAKNNKAEFSLSEFFRTKKYNDKVRFVHENEVQQWLDVIRGQDAELYQAMSGRAKAPFPYHDVNLLEALRHTIWYLPSVDACTAMYELLNAPHNDFFNDYEVLKIAGKGVGIGAAALPPVQEKITKNPQGTKTITLTCGKLLTGVTVPAWTGIFMLRELKSPETYFQAAFRVQSPWATNVVDPEVGGQKTLIFKDNCYVFDFAPNRALSQIVEYALNLGSENQDKNDRESAVRELLDFLPVLAFEGQSMNELDAEKLIDYLTHGITSSMLARRWNSPELITFDVAAMEAVLANDALLASLEEIDDYRTIRDELKAIISINKELAPKVQAKSKLDASEKGKKDEAKKKRDDIRKKLRKFVARLPVFMYLTDNREKTVTDLITKFEPVLFQQVTQLKVSDFQMLLGAKVFNEGKMNDAVWKFREFERPSLGYGLDVDEAVEEAEVTGGFSVARIERFAKLIDSGKLSDGDILYPNKNKWGVTATVGDYGIYLGAVRYADPSMASKRATEGAETDGWKFWQVRTPGGTRSLNSL